jgi:hypothetical protein
VFKKNIADVLNVPKEGIDIQCVGSIDLTTCNKNKILPQWKEA